MMPTAVVPGAGVTTYDGESAAAALQVAIEIEQIYHFPQRAAFTSLWSAVRPAFHFHLKLENCGTTFSAQSSSGDAYIPLSLDVDC